MALVPEVCGIPKLKGGDSYGLWIYQLEILFQSAGLTTIVDGTEKLEDCETAALKAAWSAKDGMARKYISFSIDVSILPHLLLCKTSHTMLAMLKSIYAKESPQHKDDLLNSYYGYKFDNSQNMLTNISELKNFRAKLKQFNENISDDALMSRVITILPEKYSLFKLAWESTSQADKTVDNLTTRLVALEAKLHLETPPEPVAFRAQGIKKQKKCKCYNCGKIGHIARDCRSKKRQREESGSAEKESKLQKFDPCTYCGRTNHLRKDCFYKPKKQHCKNENNQNKNLSTYTSFVADSGTSTHLVNDPSLLSNAVDKVTFISLAKDNDYLVSKKQGDLKLDTCTLKNVLYAPQLAENLLSVPAITDQDGTVEFDKQAVVVKRHGKSILTGNKDERGAYIINTKMQTVQSEEHAMLARQHNNDNHEMWHRRLGHLSKSKMKQLPHMCDGFTISDENPPDLPFCEVCVEAKQKRKSYNSIRHPAERILQIVHTDLCGPFIPSWDKKKYFLTFIDDFSHYSEVRLISLKSDTSYELKGLVAHAEAYQAAKTALIRTDNGGEFTSNELQNWCLIRGTRFDYTTPYTPELNGKAERLNRSIMEKARALLFDAQLEEELWGEAVMTAVVPSK